MLEPRLSTVLESRDRDRFRHHDVGDTGHMTERTAALRPMGATRELHCLNKVHAGLRAIQLGVIGRPLGRTTSYELT